MSPYRLRALVRRVVQEIRRDRPSLALLFVAPLVVTGLVTFILRGGQTPDVTVTVVAAGGPAGAVVAERVAGTLQQAGLTIVDEPTAEAAHDAVEADDVDVAILLPEDLLSGSSSVIVLTNGLDPSGEAAQIRVVSGALIGAIAGGSAGRLASIEHETV